MKFELDEDEAMSAIRKAEKICDFGIGIIPELRDQAILKRSNPVEKAQSSD